MLPSRWHLFLGLVLLFAFSHLVYADSAGDLKAKIEAVTNGKNFKHSHWGILVVDAVTGKTIYEHDADKLFLPASTTKLFSTAAALDALGSDFRFHTPVYRRGAVEDGKLKGDLILVAAGDLTLGGRTTKDGTMAFKDHDHIYANGVLGRAELTATDPLAGLNELARQVKAAGIKEVEGEILIDDRLFEKNRGTGSGPDLLTPIIVNDNIIDAVVTPAAKVGQPAKVCMHPKTGFIQMDAQVATVGAGQKARLTIQAVGFQRFVVRGQIAVDDKPRVRIYAVDDPAGFARALFIEALGRAGVKVRASLLQPPQAELPARDGYGKLKRVALFVSLPFSEAAKVTLKVSHNLYASIFPMLVAVKHGKSTLKDGLGLQRKFLAGLGVDVDSISFGGGAGGSQADCITPRAAIQLLQALAKRSDYKVFQDGLPVLGVDGTLSEAVGKDSPVKGKLRAKTGTYYWHDVMNDRSLLTSKALAGTLTTASGRSLIVAIFVNKVPLPKGVTPLREGKVIGRLCEIIYQHTPKNHE
jgi:D-alanyl-D-alanine carboxypeptidase/D-alanyl-D-alanine-endopeptidase (penicillin-binding protein 4)